LPVRLEQLRVRANVREWFRFTGLRRGRWHIVSVEWPFRHKREAVPLEEFLRISTAFLLENKGIRG
jgi:hypothetical protein